MSLGRWEVLRIWKKIVKGNEELEKRIVIEKRIKDEVVGKKKERIRNKIKGNEKKRIVEVGNMVDLDGEGIRIEEKDEEKEFIEELMKDRGIKIWDMKGKIGKVRIEKKREVNERRGNIKMIIEDDRVLEIEKRRESED